MKLIDKDALVAEIDKHLSYYKDLKDRGILSKEGEAAYRVVRILKSDINSLEVKEVDNVWHDASETPKPNMELICVGQYGNPLVLSSNSNSFKSRDISKWAYFNDLINLSNVEKTVKNWNEPISEELEKTSKEYADKNYAEWLDFVSGDERDDHYPISEAFKAGAKWLKEQMPCWKKGTLSDTPWGVNSDYLTNPEGYYIELSKLLKLPKEG